MNDDKFYNELKAIKQKLNMDWFVLTEENSKDKSKCAYGIFVDVGYYIKYIGEVGALYNTRGYAIKIKKSDFIKLFKGKNKVDKIVKILKDNIDDDYVDMECLEFMIDESNIDIKNNIIRISYGDKEEVGNIYGDIIIKESTNNCINNYKYSGEEII